MYFCRNLSQNGPQYFFYYRRFTKTAYSVLIVQFAVVNVPKDRFRGWVVKIFYKDEPVCTGTLLSNRFFVTFADCIRPRGKLSLEDFQLIIGKDTIRSISYVLESPDGNGVIVGRLLSTVAVNKDDIARIPRKGNENQVEKAGQDDRQNYVIGIGENESNKKILVLGTGMSWISAAKTFEENGLRNFQVLEGSERIGGRVKAMNMSRYTLEVGAQWIVGLGLNPIADLAEEYELSYMEDPDIWTVRDKFGTDLTDQADEEFEKLDRALNKLTKFSKTTRKKNIPDINAEGLLRRFGWAPDNIVAEAIEVYGRDLEGGKETSSCSGKYLYHLNALEEHGIDDWLILSDPRGYSIIIEKMSETFLSVGDPRLMLNKVVTSITDWNEDSTNVKVFTADGAMYEADRVIVTFSLGVLQSRQVSFGPSLPNWKMLAIDKFGFRQYSILYCISNSQMLFWDTIDMILGSVQ